MLMASAIRERAERAVSRAMLELSYAISRQADATTVRAGAQQRVAVAAEALLLCC